MNTVFLGLGSNLNDREANIQQALDLLGQNAVSIIKLSSIIETDPVGGPAQGKYLNAAAQATTDRSPEELLKLLKAIEKQMGRTSTVRNGPRIIDIDILLYNKENRGTSDLTIPHPRMFKRSFVMNPLKEIAPELVEELVHEDNF